jgi:anti-sigma factor RsiW
MTLRSCGRSEEMASMLRRGCGPNAGDEELRAHIEGCSQCKDRVLIAQRFQDARRQSVEAAPMGNAQALWWKAQLRQRDAALRQVRRPVALAQIFALVIGVIAAGGFLIAAWIRGMGWLAFGDAGELLASARADLTSYLTLFGPESNLLLLASGLGAVALLGGVVYVASDRR